jgi:hypothetical protein
MKEFFKNKDMVILVDMMAQRYGKLPHEILSELTLTDYNFNMAIMTSAINYLKEKDEKNEPENIPPSTTDWDKMGIARTVKKKKEL